MPSPRQRLLLVSPQLVFDKIAVHRFSIVGTVRSDRSRTPTSVPSSVACTRTGYDWVLSCERLSLSSCDCRGYPEREAVMMARWLSHPMITCMRAHSLSRLVIHHPMQAYTSVPGRSRASNARRISVFWGSRVTAVRCSRIVQKRRAIGLTDIITCHLIAACVSIAYKIRLSDRPQQRRNWSCGSLSSYLYNRITSLYKHLTN